jgi:hypothetical protein
MYPVAHHCLHRMMKFYRKVMLLDDTAYVKRALLEDLAASQISRKHTWHGRVLAVGECVGLTCTLECMKHADIFLSKWRRYWYDQVWGGLDLDPRSAPSRNIKLCTYHNWFAYPLPGDGTKWKMAPHLMNTNIPYQHMVALTRFRTSNHNLSIESKRHCKGRVPRSHRLCAYCHAGVQDEHHVVFECPTCLQWKANFNCLSHHTCLKQMFNDTAVAAAIASFIKLIE